jgi:chaperone required for assembly of F1-ATPase
VTTLTGSAFLALVLARGVVTPHAVWAAAHVDEDYQISLWGEDYEAANRRRLRRLEFDAACRFLTNAQAD